MEHDFTITRIYELEDGSYDKDSYLAIDDGNPDSGIRKIPLGDVKGQSGPPGPKGEDGIPATHSWEGSVLTITSASGTSSADLRGPKGKDGDSAAYYFYNEKRVNKYIHIFSVECDGKMPVMMSYATRDAIDVNLSGFLVLRTAGAADYTDKCCDFVLSCKEPFGIDRFRILIDGGTIHLYVSISPYGSISLHMLGCDESTIAWYKKEVDLPEYDRAHQIDKHKLITDSMLMEYVTFLNEDLDRTLINTVVPPDASESNKLITRNDLEFMDEHIADRNNPHQVTVEQIGTYDKDTIDYKTSYERNTDIYNVRIGSYTYRVVRIGDLYWTADNFKEPIGTFWPSKTESYGYAYDANTLRDSNGDPIQLLASMLPKGWRWATKDDFDVTFGLMGTTNKERALNAIRVGGCGGVGKDAYGWSLTDAGYYEKGTWQQVGLNCNYHSAKGTSSSTLWRLSINSSGIDWVSATPATGRFIRFCKDAGEIGERPIREVIPSNSSPENPLATLEDLENVDNKGLFVVSGELRFG